MFKWINAQLNVFKSIKKYSYEFIGIPPPPNNELFTLFIALFNIDALKYIFKSYCNVQIFEV